MADPRPSRRRYDIALWIDNRIGPVLCWLALGLKRLLPRETAPPERIRRVLLLKMWGMGSIVLASPLVEKLREQHPDVRIDFVTLRENEPVLRFYPGIDRVITIGLERGVIRFLVDALRTIAQLRRERYDLLLDLEFFTRFSALFSLLVRPAWSHGYSAKGKWRGRLHDVEVPFNAYAHVARNFLTLLSGDPMTPVDVEDLSRGEVLPRIEPAEGAWQRCAAKLAEDPAWREGEPIVVVNPNAGDMALERRWPVERMGELLQHLTARRPVNVVLVGSRAERAHVDEVVRASGAAQRLVNFAGRSDLDELVALLAHAAGVITNDSGPMHLACAAGASVVALFGPETPTLYGPLRATASQRHAVHYLRLGCSPCMFVHDNKVLSCWFSQARCMAGIAAGDVLASIEALLDGREAGGSARELRAIDS
ncbi:MAG: glycosyltransferase family 9 protein [Myxococcota bacterium]